ncbi:MAG: NnrU family protein [bacterium]
MDVLPISAVVFVAAHLLISGTPLRGFLVRRIGEGPFRGLFSLIALGTLIWLIRAYNAATPELLWVVPALRWAPLALMPFALMLLVTGVTSPNPSLAGQEGRLRKEIKVRGVIRITRHPANMGIALWAMSHLLANGDVGSLWFFGSLLALSVAGSASQDQRKAREAGPHWEAFARSTSLLPFAAILAGRNTLRAGEIGLWRPGLGLAIYAILIFVHPYLFGVAAY